MIFFVVFGWVIVQRMVELLIARRNTKRLMARGGVEFGADHYGMMILLHAGFFGSVLVEHEIRGDAQPILPWYLIAGILLLAQVARFWIIHSMKGRWTTRIIALKNEVFVRSGPFRFFSHPNYVVVAVEILMLPLLFGLNLTAMLFTILNAIVLLGIRIPEEEKSFRWARGN